MSSEIRTSSSLLEGDCQEEEVADNGADDIVIRVTNLNKVYQIYNRPEDRLKQFFYPRFQRLIGRKSQNYYYEFWALRNVSFEVRKGEVVGIVGRNGAGKSTLLQVICGTLHPSGGTVETYGRVAALLELGSGFNIEFTGRENVYLNAAILGLTSDEIDEKFDDIAAFADIGNFIEQPIKSYSSGMVVRLAFAVQAMIDPEILIVDEALAVGDEKFQRKCFARLEQLRSNGTSILFVSHSGPQVTELCKSALLLEAGEQLMFSEPKHVVRAYQKLIYAPQEEQQRLVMEFRTQDETAKKGGETRKAEKVNSASVPQGNNFDLGFVPETTTVYPEQGVRINTIRILNDLGQDVNILQSMESYHFVVSGCFLSDVEGIHFGIHIRTISGVTITGQRHPEEGRQLGPMCGGDDFEISFGFRMSLLPGVYFVGGGVWKDKGNDCLHRIIDALMFRIVSIEPQRSFGYCNVASNEPDLKMP